MTPADVLEGRARWCVVHGDNRDVLSTLPDRSVAHVITDPPYDARTHRGAVTGSTASGVPEFAPLLSPSALSRRLVDLADRWVLAFCTLEDIAAWRDGAPESWIRAGVWDRVAVMPQLTGDRPAQAVEAVAILHRPGRKRWNGGGKAAIWRHMSPRGDERPDHPTPKPVSLMLELIELFTDPDDVVLDPFAGSGTTGVACLRLGRRFIGIERDETYAQVARDRLAAEDRGLSLRDARAGQQSIFDVLTPPRGA